MILGVEIGGTNIRLGVGTGADPQIISRRHFTVDRSQDARGILNELGTMAAELTSGVRLTAVGCGFGGPVDNASGTVALSHQVEGWESFPLQEWLSDTLSAPAFVENDTNLGGLAETIWGVGQHRDPVFYITVGTGVGGALVKAGRIYAGAAPGSSEIGHMTWPKSIQLGPGTVESMASGPAIERNVRESVHRWRSTYEAGSPEMASAAGARLGEGAMADVMDLLDRCDSDTDRITTLLVGEAAGDGNGIARSAVATAARALGWAVGQVMTLLCPEVFIIGGGVSKLSSDLFLDEVLRHARQHVIETNLKSLKIVPSFLGDEVVVQGALAYARQRVAE